jgi:rare lipoprotein A
MKTFFKSILAVLPLALVAPATAGAAQDWKQNCSGPQYVCGGEATVAKAKTVTSAKVQKPAKVAKAKVKKPAAAVSSAPVKAKNKVAQKVKAKSPAKVASAPKKSKAKVAKASGGTSYQGGVASWYGGNFHGRKTANGETYNMNAMTAAHKTLPFGTKVRVTNTRNGDSVVVRINDRGPFIAGRVIDLSRAAASQIGVTSSGVAPVKLAILGRG